MKLLIAEETTSAAKYVLTIVTTAEELPGKEVGMAVTGECLECFNVLTQGDEVLIQGTDGKETLVTIRVPVLRQATLMKMTR